MDLSAPLYAQLRAESAPIDWLAHMILAVKTMAAGAEFIPLPYIRAVFGTVVIFLETVDVSQKMKKNRDDLRDLCASTVEIVLLVRGEISANGSAAGARFMGLCERFISFMRLVQIELEMLMKSRAGVRGRIKEFVGAISVAGQIEHHRCHAELVATIDINLNVADIHKSMSALHETNRSSDQFRRIALGDINLLYETALSSKVHKIKVFTAQISGEPFPMTVAKYEDINQRWKSDLKLCSSLRHPNVWQLFGVSTVAGWSALIFHDEILPLWIYRKFHRPSSDLVWGCIEGILVQSLLVSFKQFRDCSDHHYWSTGENKEKGLEATICVKQNPIRLCLTMPGLGNDSEVRDLEYHLSAWHTHLFQHQNIAPETFSTVANILTATSDLTPTTLASHIDWTHCLTAMLPIRFNSITAYGMQTKLFLGSVVTQISGSDDLVPVAYIPNSSRIRIPHWVLQQCPNVHPTPEGDGCQKQFRFPSGTFKASEIPNICTECPCLVSSIELEGFNEDLVHTIKANVCTTGTIITLECVIIVDTEIRHQLRREGTLREAYLFPCPIRVRHHGRRIGLEFPHADHWHWSFDPSGVTKMTLDECDSIGLPRWKFVFLPVVKAWHEYHYNAIHEFSETRGFDPYSNDASRRLGLPLAETESYIPTNGACPTLPELRTHSG
ncbi:hypothetical protein DFH08DRAFT_932046 [Mycena albidolilacea]|uniref:Uncharacterized protein n=1 Tax=Mycena albidolilacea TaxID=1033008 RepID=A0AAD7F081_9AGAR|nr:hypothetical protein DFH08DRAFT_932046 [Mycena albidolilacea]